MPDVRCTLCASEFSLAEVARVGCCPACGHGGVPMATTDDVTIAVNWHELRVLGIWAENWAAQHRGSAPHMQRIVAAICGRLLAQHPDKAALTMSGEIAGLRQAFPGQVEVQGFNEDEEANSDA